MSKVIEKIISSPKAPSNKNVGWWNGKELKFYTNGQWNSGKGNYGESSTPFIDIATSLEKTFPVFKMSAEYKSFEDIGITSEILNMLLFSKFVYNTDFYQDFMIKFESIIDTHNTILGKGYLRGHCDYYSIIYYNEDGDEIEHRLTFSIDFKNKTGICSR